MTKLSFLALVLTIANTARAATAAEWRSRSIYQVVTDRYALMNNSITAPCDPSMSVYCGGSWQGIINNLDYIQNMGFDAIWISPVTEQVSNDTSVGEAYHGYWPNNMNEVNNNFGDAADLKALSKALHDRGMYLMVDIVVNHMAWVGSPSNVDYSQLIPFDNSSYYHPYCPLSDNDVVCWAGGGPIQLADLKTETANVQAMFGTWVTNLISQYDIDGLRLDSALNVDIGFFTAFSKAAGIFSTGEVLSGVNSDVCPYQAAIGSVLNYPTYYPLIRALSASGSFVDLATEMTSLQGLCNDTTVMGSFSENHDQPRFASYTSDIALAKNVLAYTILTDGIPIIYNGQEQHFNGGATPFNREAVWLSGYNTSSVLYNHITDLNVFRKHFSNSTGYLTYMSQPIYSTTNTLALRKGNNGTQVITIINNDGASGKSRNITLGSTGIGSVGGTGFAAGDIVTDVVSCKNTTVDSDGNLEVTIQNGLPNVFYPAKLLVGSTICVNGKTSLPAPVVVSTSTSTSSATGTTSKPTGTSGSKTSSSSPNNTLASGAERVLHRIGIMFTICCVLLTAM